MTLDFARLHELRGWTQAAMERLGVTIDGERVLIPVRDATGDLVGRLRYQPDPTLLNGQTKMLAESGTTRELFPPPETIGDDEADGIVWLDEGEPDTLALWSIGLVAVGVPGAQNWRDESAARFAGRRWTVVVCFDCDETGRTSALRAANALVARGVDVRLVDLAPTRDDGYDLSDFVRAAATSGASREQVAQMLVERVEQAPPYVAVETTMTSSSKQPWRVQGWSEFRDTSPQSHRWLVEGLLPEGALVFIAGPPKRGKTWLGIALALAVASGRPLFGEYAVPEPRAVLYVALEGSRVGLRARIGALARGLGLDPDGDDLARLHMLYRPRPFDLVDASSESDFETARALIDEAARLDAALVIIDVLRAAARFKENDQSDFARVRDAIEPMLAAGRSVPLLHHFGKLSDTQQQRSPGERMAGTGAMYGALDVGFLITRSESGARRLRVEIEARDFAAPDALGVVITGTGAGEHGGFTYTDEAQLVLDESAVEGRDLVSEIETLFGDGVWRTLDEIAASPEADPNKPDKLIGIGANKDDARDALSAAPDRFVLVEGRRVVRHPTAKPYGTIAMLRKLEEAEEVARATELPERAEAVSLDELLGEQVAPLKGRATELPAHPELADGSERPNESSHPIDEVERLADRAREWTEDS